MTREKEKMVKDFWSLLRALGCRAVLNATQEQKLAYRLYIIGYCPLCGYRHSADSTCAMPSVSMMTDPEMRLHA